jgi:FSR family fosmidomycin resistance protein-like MFS transporter
MSLFSVGGNAGFAIGPLLTTPLVLAFGLPGTLALCVLPYSAAVMSVRELPRLRGLEQRRAAAEVTGEDDWGAFGRLSALIAARSGVHFGMQAIVPSYFVAELATSKATGNGALTLFLAAGAVGTLVGGGLVDRWGPRTVLVGTMVALLPPLLILPVVGEAGAIVLVATIGFFTIASFSVTVILGQAYLPHHVGLASGVTLGLAIGLGGVAATVLGAVADRWGLETALWVIAVLPIPAILLALSLPRSPRREARVRVRIARAGHQESQ